MPVENNMNIGEIIYEDKLKCFCPLGKDYYHNNFVITINPSKMIPDYIILHEAIQELHCHELIIEDAVAKVLDIVKEYDPIKVIVKSVVTDAPHPKVTITKSYLKPITLSDIGFTEAVSVPCGNPCTERDCDCEQEEE